MPRYVWTVQPIKGRLGDPTAQDWSVLQGTYRLSGLETRQKAQRRAIEMAREVAPDLPPGSELVVKLADAPFGPAPEVELWSMTTKAPASRVKWRAPAKGKIHG